MPRALIFGVTGQDGAYLASFLLEKNYTVFGTSRNFLPSQLTGLKRMRIQSKIHKINADLAYPNSIGKAIKESNPDEIYNLAGDSSVADPYKNPILTTKVNALGVVQILEQIRKNHPATKFFQASSSEMYSPQKGKITEDTPFDPSTPYAISKVFSHNMVMQYRKNFDVFACCGILFNHESPLRTTDFVTRKITNSLARIKLKKIKEFTLGNIETRRDWGFAGDYVRAMWLMLQNKDPDDFIIASGESHSIKELLDIASRSCGLDNWKRYVKIDNSLKRKNDYLEKIGNPNKAKRILGWKPTMTFPKLINLMVQYDLQQFNKNALKHFPLSDF